MRSQLLALAIFFSAFCAPMAIAFTELDPTKVSAAVEGEELVIRRLSDNQEIERVAVIKVNQGDRFYHWTKPENQARWVSQGFVDKGEMDFLSTPSGTRQAYGPGFYVSDNPFDSDNYGPQGVVATAPRDYYFVNADLSQLQDSKIARETHEVLKRAGVFGNRATETWRVLFDEYAVSQLQPIDAGAMLDHRAATGKPVHTGILDAVAAKFGLRPHPVIEANFPSVQKVLLGQGLNAGEEAVIQKILREHDHLRAALEPILPPDTMMRFRFESAVSSRRPVLDILRLDQDMGGLKPSPVLREKVPDLADLLEGKPLNSEAHSVIWRELNAPGRGWDGLALFNVELKSETPLLARLREEFKPDLRDALRSEIPSDALISRWLPTARHWGFSLNELAPGFRDPGGALPKGFALGDAARTFESLGDFGKNLATAFSFIDHFDLARAVAEGNPEPWKLYDEPGKEPLLTRWQKALGAHKQRSPVLLTQEALVGHPVSFRAKRVVAGGDVLIPGEAFGFARMTEEQVAALRANRFLTLYVKDDPWPQHGGRKTHLVRYEYPSAATFENFSGDLSEKLAKELKAAKKAGKLSSEHTAEFQDLTRRIVSELWGTATDEDPLLRYQKRMAVHPFEDYNGRLARLLYQGETGRPLVLPQWDLDLLSHPAELAAHQGQGDIAYRKILQGLAAQEKLNPQFPRYYDTPEIFNTLLDLPDGAQSSVGELKAFLKSPAAGDMLRKKEITEARWSLWDLEGRRWAKLPEKERASTLKAWIDARYVPEFRDEKLFRQLLEESKKLATKDPGIARWWIQAASGADPAHGGLLADFLRNLETTLKRQFDEARLLSETPLSLAYTAEERVAFFADTAAALNNPKVEASEKLRRARLYLRQQIANPGSRARPFDEILKLAPIVKDPAFYRAFNELLQDTRFPERRQLFEAALLLPEEGLRKVQDTILRQLSGKPGLRPRFSAEIAKRFAERGDAELAGRIFRNVEQGYLPEDLLRDEKLFRRYLGGADLKNPVDRLLSLSRDPVLAQRALQSFADRKEWADFFALAKMLNLGSVVAPQTAEQKQVAAVLKSGLRRAAADPSRSLLANIFLAQVETDLALKAAAEDRASRALLKSFGTPGFNDDFALFLSGPEGKARAEKLLPSIFASDSAAAIEALKYIPYELFETITWRPEYDEAIARAQAKIPPAAQEDILRHFANSEGAKARTQLVLAFKASSPGAQLKFLEGAHGLFHGNDTNDLFRAAAGASDPKVRAAVMKNFSQDPKDQARLADLYQRLFSKGDSALFEKTLPANWPRVADLYLSGIDAKDRAGIQDRWRSQLLGDLKKLPGRKGADAQISVLEFLSRPNYSPDERAEAIYTALETVHARSMNERSRQAVHRFAFLRLQSPYLPIDAKRLYDIYQASRDPQLINDAVNFLERAPYSPEKTKLLAEGLQSKVNDVRYTARHQLRTILENPADGQSAQPIVKQALENFVKRDPTRTWRGYRSEYDLKQMDSLFRAVGMSPEDAAQAFRQRPLARTVAQKLETCALRFQLLVPSKRNQARGLLKARKQAPDSWRPPSIFKDPAIVASGGAALVGAAAVVDMAYSVLLHRTDLYGGFREPYTFKALSAAMKAATGIYATGEEWMEYVMTSKLAREEKARIKAAIEEADARERADRRDFRDRYQGRESLWERDRARRDQQRRLEERERKNQLERYRRENAERYVAPGDDDDFVDDVTGPASPR